MSFNDLMFMFVDKGLTGIVFAIVATWFAFKIVTKVQEKPKSEDKLINELKNEIGFLKEEINLLSTKSESENLSNKISASEIDSRVENFLKDKISVVCTEIVIA